MQGLRVRKGDKVLKIQVFNPYLPSYEYIPDGEPYVFDDRLYIFGSHDKFNGVTYCENDYVCWSAPVEDLSDWRFEGTIYKKDQHPHQAEKNFLYAPDVTKGPDGRYYLYYSVAHSSIISVAVCDTPAGKYEYYGDVKYKSGDIVGKGPGEFYQFDPGIFIDEDGTIYLYSGFCPKAEEDELGRKYVGAHVCVLEDDMITIKEEPKVLISRDRECPDGARYFEAPSVRKIDGRYYFVYSARITGLHYYVSQYPDKEFIYGGVIHSSSDIGLHDFTEENPAYPVGNTHGGIVFIKGQYYIFDHRFSNNSSFCRQGVAEPIFIDAEGKIKQVEATSCGLNGGPLDGVGVYPAYIACNLIDKNQYNTKEEKKSAAAYITQEGEDRETEPGQYLYGWKNGWIVGYKYFDLFDLKSIRIKVRGKANGLIKVSTKREEEFIGEGFLNIDSMDWTDIIVPVNTRNGIAPLYFTFDGDGCLDMLSFELIA